MKIKQIHHVAYRCNDAKETVNFYRDMMNMDFILAISEDRVPSTKEPDPYMHLFMDAGNGNILAFFEIPNSPPMGRDPNTPDWVQHIAFELESEENRGAVFRVDLPRGSERLPSQSVNLRPSGVSTCAWPVTSRTGFFLRISRPPVLSTTV